MTRNYNVCIIVEQLRTLWLACKCHSHPFLRHRYFAHLRSNCAHTTFILKLKMAKYCLDELFYWCVSCFFSRWEENFGCEVSQLEFTFTSTSDETHSEYRKSTHPPLTFAMATLISPFARFYYSIYLLLLPNLFTFFLQLCYLPP